MNKLNKALLHLSTILLIGIVIVLAIIIRPNFIISLGVSIYSFVLNFIALFSRLVESNWVPQFQAINFYAESNMNFSIIFEQFIGVENLKTFGSVLITPGNFVDFFFTYLDTLRIILLAVIIFAIFAILAYLFWIPFYVEKEVLKHGKTKQLKSFEKAKLCVLTPLSVKLVAFLRFVFVDSIYKWILLFVFLFASGIGFIVIDLIGYLFYLLLTFDFSNWFNFFSIVAYHLWPLLIPYVFIVVTIITIALISVMQHKIARGKNERLHKVAIDFIKEHCGVVNYISGVPGAGKTSLIVDFSIIGEFIIESSAYEIMNQAMNYFPYFDWNNLKKRIHTRLSNGELNNDEQVRVWIANIESKFWQYQKLFTYDHETHGLFHFNSLVNYSIFEVLTHFASAYLITLYKNKIFSNFPIRSAKCFDGWDFLTPTKESVSDVYFIGKEGLEVIHTPNLSLPLDFDMLRLGKKYDAENKASHQFWCGVVAIMETSKEFMNQNTIRVFKELHSNDSNPESDMTAEWLSMSRQISTIWNRCLGYVFADDQREGNTQSRVVEVSEARLYLPKIEEEKSSLPGIWFRFLFLDLCIWFLSIWISDNSRIDKALLMTLLLKSRASCQNRKEYLINNFTYKLFQIQKKDAGLDSFTPLSYPFLKLRIHANRFSTNIFKTYVALKKALATYCVFSASPYLSLVPQFDWLNQTHSHNTRRLIDYDQMYNTSIKSNMKGENVNVEEIFNDNYTR